MKRLNSIVLLVSLLVVAVLCAAQAYAQQPTIRKPGVKLNSLIINQQLPVGEMALDLKIVASESLNYADTDSRDLATVARRSFGRLMIGMQNSAINQPFSVLKTSGIPPDRATAFYRRE